METRLLPPSGRDFEAYRLVRFEEKSTREAAAELGISQTLIRRIVERVGDFLSEAAPGEDDEIARRKRLNVAEQVAAERVDHLYGEAVRGFRASKGVQTTVREDALGATSSCMKMSHGECRYLMTAARLAIAGGKLPVSRLNSYVDWDEEVRKEEEAEKQAERHTDASCPGTPGSMQDPLPQGEGISVCSAVVEENVVTANAAQRAADVKSVAVEACGSPPVPAGFPKSNETKCAQLPVSPPAKEKLDRRKQEARRAFLGQLKAPTG